MSTFLILSIAIDKVFSFSIYKRIQFSSNIIFPSFQTSMAADSHKELQKSVTFGNWVRKDIQYSQFQNYELTYAHFVRFPTPFSWEIWQPGLSPGNSWNLVKTSSNRLLILRRDANSNIFTFSKLFYSIQILLTFQISSTFTTYHKTHVDSQNVKLIKMHEMITFLIKASLHWINHYNIFTACFIPAQKLGTISKEITNCYIVIYCHILPLFQIICHIAITTNISKYKIETNLLKSPKNKTNQPNFVKSNIQKKSPSYNQMKNQTIFYEQLHLYISLCSLTINNLLNFKILVYQIIQMKLITSSWWRDKISWYLS